MDSAVAIQRSWRFSSKRLIEVLPVASDPSLDVAAVWCSYSYGIGILRPSMECSSPDSHGELIARLHWLACCRMPYKKRCPSLCCPMVDGGRVRVALLVSSLNLSQSAFLKFHRLTGNFSSTRRVGDG